MGNINKENIYNALIKGAKEVMKNRLFLNKINVFPVADADTGNNLYSMMQSVILHSEIKQTLKETLESVADSAIVGARGNSGIIFAQYFQGISQVNSDKNEISTREFALAVQSGFKYAYEAVEKPVEGTILTTMRVFYESLSESNSKEMTFKEMLEMAYNNVDEAVHKTTKQLIELRKASFVDSGAKGFAYFIKGFIKGIEGDLEEPIVDVLESVDGKYQHNNESHFVPNKISFRYCTEALLEGSGVNIPQLKKSMTSFGDSLVLAGGEKKVRLHIHTDVPHEVFEFLEEDYTILSQKVDDMISQQNVVHNRKYKTLIITDSIADIPKYIIDEEQIGIIHLNILLGTESYIDKLTITNNQLFKLAKKKGIHPTSSQPSLKIVEENFRYLLKYYEEILVISVSKALSGTFNVLTNAAKSVGKQVMVFDSKQNSVAQGLIVWKAIEALKAGNDSDEMKALISKNIENTKILVSVKTLDNMIASGRLSTRMGSLARKIGLKPVITLNSKGEGKIFKIALSSLDANKKILEHVYKVSQKHQILNYAITYIDDKEGGEKLALSVKEILGFECEYVVESSSVIAAGAGKGALAVAYVIK